VLDVSLGDGWNPLPFDRAQGMLQARRKSVIPLENGIQVKGMDPGFHRGDDKAWIPAFAGKTEGAVDFESTLSEPLGF